MAVTNNSSKLLQAFTTAATALPAVTLTNAALADEMVRNEKVNISSLRGQYDEAGGRMDVDINQITLTTPVADKFEVGINYIRDKISGASPVLNVLDDNGNPEQVLQSHATIEDVRDVIDTTIKYYGEAFTLSTNIGQSKEDDYESFFGSVDYRKPFNNKHTTLLLSSAYADDEVWNVYDPENPYSTPSVYHDKTKLDLMLGVTQVINKNSLFQVNLTHSRIDGFQADIYKSVLIFGAGVKDDTRPEDRELWLLYSRYSQYFSDVNGALHVSGRLADDSWKTDSKMIELKWSQESGEKLTIAPYVRWYTQNSAYFYDIFFRSMPEDGYFSSDYRLASFGTLTPGIEATFNITYDVSVSFDYLRISRKKSHQWGSDGIGSSIDDYSSTIISLTLNASL